MSNPQEQFGRRLVVNLNAGVRRELKRRFWKYMRRAFRRDIDRDTENANVKQRSGWYD